MPEIVKLIYIDFQAIENLYRIAVNSSANITKALKLVKGAEINREKIFLGEVGGGGEIAR